LGEYVRTPLEPKNQEIEPGVIGEYTGLSNQEDREISFKSAFLNDIRTRCKSKDPVLLKLIEDVRLIKAMVESGDHMAVPGQSESFARVSRKGGAIADTDASHP
jgi:hypothetical protein